MRLDAMLGKTTVGIEKKIKEPTIEEVQNNIEQFSYLSKKNHLRKPYEIPGGSLIMKHDESTEK
ncbi:MAG: hypothetical protein E7314_04880 [Clostridiales bacterium]|nr:hypothetical protein [Clostridiales bacterium]